VTDRRSIRVSLLLREIAVWLLALPIRAYRLTISPLLPPSCRFQPTCSAYALEAIHTHGPVKGLWLALRRIARCHPISWLGGSSGFDPVPPARSR
jgi:putative membrane protein insertion efficiency factor